MTAEAAAAFVLFSLSVPDRVAVDVGAWPQALEARRTADLPSHFKSQVPTVPEYCGEDVRASIYTYCASYEFDLQGQDADCHLANILVRVDFGWWEWNASPLQVLDLFRWRAFERHYLDLVIDDVSRSLVAATATLHEAEQVEGASCNTLFSYVSDWMSPNFKEVRTEDFPVWLHETD